MHVLGKGCVGRLPRNREFNCVEEFSEAIVNALNLHSANANNFDIGRTDYEQVSSQQFWESYARQGRPVVLTGAAQAMGYDLNAWSAMGLAASYPDYPITLREGGEKGGDYELVETTATTLSNYMESSGKRGTSGKSEYGANNYLHPDLVKRIVLPDIGYPSHVFRLMDTRLWISTPSSTVEDGTALHQDLQDNAVLMLGGRKTFYLQPPHEVEHARSVTPFLRSAVDGSGGNVGGGSGGSGGRSISSGVSIDLDPGDLLFLPAGWWHRTKCLPGDGTVSINFFMSACFAALGVVVPKLVESDWLLLKEQEESGPKIHSR